MGEKSNSEQGKWFHQAVTCDLKYLCPNDVEYRKMLQKCGGRLVA